MKKQFVTYPIALALKEIEFDELCIARFNSDGELIILRQSATSNISLVSTIKNSEDITLFIGDIITPICAPLWQQVIDWFREEHHIIITVLYCHGHGEFVYSIDEPETSIRIYSCQSYSGYGVTREAAILQAIEIIKNK